MMRPGPGGLLRRLLLFILLFSLCFTVLASTVQLYIEDVINCISSRNTFLIGIRQAINKCQICFFCIKSFCC